MNLGARFLTAVGGVNVFGFTTAVEAVAGDAFDVYFQFVDKEQHTNSNGFFPAGNRYMPAAGSTVTVTVLNLDSAKQFIRVATQPYVQDASIWKFSILTTDPVAATVSLKITLTDGAVVRTVYAQAALRINGIGETC